jgi:hypothetical protein
MKLRMEFIPSSYEIEDGFTYCYGKIFIGDDFCETIIPAIGYWSANDYKKQWQEGLERIRTHDSSCLVASIQNPYTSPDY